MRHRTAIRMRFIPLDIVLRHRTSCPIGTTPFSGLIDAFRLIKRYAAQPARGPSASRSPSWCSANFVPRSHALASTEYKVLDRNESPSEGERKSGAELRLGPEMNTRPRKLMYS